MQLAGPVIHTLRINLYALSASLSTSLYHTMYMLHAFLTFLFLSPGTEIHQDTSSQSKCSRAKFFDCLIHNKMNERSSRTYEYLSKRPICFRGGGEEVHFFFQALAYYLQLGLPQTSLEISARNASNLLSSFCVRGVSLSPDCCRGGNWKVIRLSR